jgi:Ca2+-binding RTX toxin-like protein
MLCMATLTSNADKKKGTAKADAIDGLTGNDTLFGLSGNDTLLGGVGADSLDGGTDNDQLKGDEGNDTLLGSAGSDFLDGGADNDELDGGAGADTLDGGTGVDSLTGGDGNDVYVIDNIGDRLTEANQATSGIDTVRSSIDYTLGANLEHLILTGLTHLKAVGNALANRLTGNAGNNWLDGAEGLDTLQGGDGDDTLIGGSGINELRGESGSDTYQINSTEDTIIEAPNGGDQDVVESSVSHTLPAQVEMLILTGSASLDGTGNSLDNTLQGNEADNQLRGESGNDRLTGESGNDTLQGGAGDDTLDGGAGRDQAVYSGKQANYRLIPAEEADTWLVQDINGREGNDRLSGLESVRFADIRIDLAEWGATPPRLLFEDLSLTEGQNGSKLASFGFTLSRAATEPVSVDYTTVPVTATADVDYMTQAGTLVFEPGQTRQSLDIRILGDTTVEADESFRLQFSNPLGLELSRTIATATLLNDERPTLAIASLSRPEGNDGAASLKVAVTLSSPSTSPVTVQYQTLDGTALAGKDYTAASGSLSFKPGATRQFIDLTVKADTVQEPDEYLEILLSNPAGAILDAAAGLARITLTNDDVPGQNPTLRLSSDETVFKAGDRTTIHFAFSSRPLGFEVSDVVVSGGRLQDLRADDSGLGYTALFIPTQGLAAGVATLQVPAGRFIDATGLDSLASNTLRFTGDTLSPSLTLGSDKTVLKPGETTTLRLRFSEMPQGFGEDDLQVNGGTLGELQSDGLLYSVPFTLTAATASVQVANGSFSDAAGNAGTVAGRLQFSRQQALPSVSLAGTTITEGQSGASFATLTLSLSSPSSQPVSVNYSTQDGTAQAGSDYVSSSNTLNFAANQTTATLQVPILGDSQVEPNESFKVTLSSPVNATLGSNSSAVVTINNDDQAAVVLPKLSISGVTVKEGNSGSSTVNATVTLSAASSETVSVNYTTQDGTATANSDYIGIPDGSTLYLAPGVTRQTIALNILGDTTVEADETFKLVLSNAGNALLDTVNSSALITLGNDDTASQTSGGRYTKGQAVIDLGKDYGKLINPVTVDGGRVYYYWDVSGDGTKAGTDYVTHDWLDELFRQDVNGRTGGNGNTDNTYRYATINGVKLALPTVGNGDDFIGSGEYGDRKGTAVQGTANNPTYDDYLAIWDAYNGTSTGTDIDGTPPGWYVYFYYWSATPAASGHAYFVPSYGFVNYDVDYKGFYVAVEVL